jgi:hypothetical protein
VRRIGSEVSFFMMDDFSPLSTSDHWLGWLGDDPGQAVRSQIEGILRQQVPTARLDWVRRLETPYYLTGARKLPDDPGNVIVTRAGLAVPFELQVRSAAGVDRLCGVVSWVASGLDGARRDRVYVDLDAEFSAACEQLTARIYELDAPSDTDARP